MSGQLSGQVCLLCSLNMEKHIPRHLLSSQGFGAGTCYLRILIRLDARNPNGSYDLAIHQYRYTALQGCKQWRRQEGTTPSIYHVLIALGLASTKGCGSCFLGGYISPNRSTSIQAL